MKRKTTYTGPIVLPMVIGVALAITGFRIYAHFRPSPAAYGTQSADMPTFEEIQEELVRRGHNIEIDGRIGKQTLNAWDAEICDQEASKMFERMEAGK